MLRLTFLLTCLLTLWAAPVLAQGDDAALKVKNAPLPQVLRQLELKTDYRFLYPEYFTMIIKSVRNLTLSLWLSKGKALNL